MTESSAMDKGDVHGKKIMKNLHPKCAKLQKEGDEESWISGEELQTDGSSDEEKTTKLKKLQQSSASDNMRKKEKTRKERNLKKQESVAMFNRLKMRSLNSVGDNDDNNNNNKQSSDSLTESLNLENRWRPKRGSLKLPSLKDDDAKFSCCSYTGKVQQERSCENFKKFIDEHKRQMNDIQESIKKLELAIDENWKLFQIENDERKKIHEQLKELETTPTLFSLIKHDVDTEISSDHAGKNQNKSNKPVKIVELTEETDQERDSLDQIDSELGDQAEKFHNKSVKFVESTEDTDKEEDQLDRVESKLSNQAEKFRKKSVKFVELTEKSEDTDKEQDLFDQIESDLGDKAEKFRIKLVKFVELEETEEISNRQLTDNEQNRLDQLVSKLDVEEVEENAFEISVEDREKLSKIDEELEKSNNESTSI